MCCEGPWDSRPKISGKSSICTNIERDVLVEYRGNTDGLKVVS